MAYYRVCPYCQANLDSGERCDCKEKPPLMSQASKAAGSAEQAKQMYPYYEGYERKSQV